MYAHVTVTKGGDELRGPVVAVEDGGKEVEIKGVGEKIWTT